MFTHGHRSVRLCSIPQATPEEYKQFTRLDEQLTANEIVAFRLKAIAELEELDEQEAALTSSAAATAAAAASLAVVAGEHAVPRQTWGQWLLRREPAPIAAPSGGGRAGDGADDGSAGQEDLEKSTGAEAGSGAATQREDAAAQAEFLRAFSSPGGDGDGEDDGADEHKHR